MTRKTLPISLMEHDPEFGEAHALFHKLWSKSGTTAYDKKDWLALDTLLGKLGMRPPGKRTDWPVTVDADKVQR